MNYVDFFSRVTQRAAGPFDYQRALGESDWPDVLNIPTGLGKTAAVIVAWLYKRMALKDSATPRRLIYCLPMRVLVEQTADCARDWALAAAAITGTPAPRIHVLMGDSADLKKADWAEHPEVDTIIIGTQDMLLSRALMRGYGMSRYQWPVHFAMLHNDAMWIFDEVQLMGPGLITSSQLEAFRQNIGCARACRSLWVSATLNAAWMRTVDFDPEKLVSLQLGEQERNSDAVRSRRESVKPLRRSPVALNGDGKAAITSYVADLAKQIVEIHRAGTTTLAILNTVERAQSLFDAIALLTTPQKTKKGAATITTAFTAALLLVHSRFRAHERKALNDALLTQPEPDGPGRIIVATQAIEAGVDLSARVLFTELAPLASMIQRFGRCNRYGEFNQTADAQVYWIDVQDYKPYQQGELDDARQQLLTLSSAAPSALPAINSAAPLYPVLRRKDFIDLFNTEADLSGFDVDIAQYIRDADDADVLLFWRNWSADIEAGDQPPAAQAELCRAGIGAAKKLLGLLNAGDVYQWDTLARQWRGVGSLKTVRLRPGMILMLRATAGGYRIDRGLSPDSREAVPTAASADTDTTTIEAMDDDARSLLTYAVSLPRHLEDVGNQAQALCVALSVPQLKAVVRAARWHDVGKAHEAFQSMIHNAHHEGTQQRLGPGHWAKSGRNEDPATQKPHKIGRPRYYVSRGSQLIERAHFRHELASALAWLEQHGGEPDADLIAYLIAAHHGKLRMSLRALPHETEPPDRRLFARGIWDGDLLPEVRFEDGEIVPTTELHLDLMRLGEGPRGASWTTRTQRLLKFYGPFQLSWLESLVRIADWRASRQEQEAAREH